MENELTGKELSKMQSKLELDRAIANAFSGGCLTHAEIIEVLCKAVASIAKHMGGEDFLSIELARRNGATHEHPRP